MPIQNVAVISIRRDAGRPLGLDVKDILAALGPRLDGWLWCVKGLDWLGGDAAEALCRKVDAARPGGVWLASAELRRFAQDVYQTIDGEFYAFPRATDIRAVDPHELHPAAFPSSAAELAILAVDGSYFDVLAKDPQNQEPLRHLPGARDEDPGKYFI